MASRNIVVGQPVDPAKVQRSKELRCNMTEAERVLWERLRGNRLNGRHFRRQQVIAGFIVDFYCHAASLAIELDGPVHNEQVELDEERDSALDEHGIAVLHFRNEEVLASIEAVLERINMACCVS